MRLLFVRRVGSGNVYHVERPGMREMCACQRTVQNCVPGVTAGLRKILRTRRRPEGKQCVCLGTWSKQMCLRQLWVAWTNDRAFLHPHPGQRPQNYVTRDVLRSRIDNLKNEFCIMKKPNILQRTKTCGHNKSKDEEMTICYQYHYVFATTIIQWKEIEWEH
jgi:hypothetical protein